VFGHGFRFWGWPRIVYQRIFAHECGEFDVQEPLHSVLVRHLDAKVFAPMKLKQAFQVLA